MQYRLIFWSRERPHPRIIDECHSTSVRQAARDCMAPIGDPAWMHEMRGEKLFLIRGDAGYCCEPVPPVPRILVNKRVRFVATGKPKIAERPRLKIREKLA